MHRLPGLQMELMDSRRFLDRIWRLLIDDNGNLNPKIKENVEQESGLRESLPSNREKGDGRL